MTRLAWVLAISVLVTDSAGHHPIKPIAVDGAQAIIDTCKDQPNEYARSMCMAVFIVMAFRESGYKLDAIGDGGKAKGPFQLHSPPTSPPPPTWAAAVAEYAPVLRRSALTCQEPLAMLASGSCTNAAGIAISRSRMALAREIVSKQPYATDQTP